MALHHAHQVENSEFPQNEKRNYNKLFIQIILLANIDVRRLIIP